MLTKETIKANEILASLTPEQLTAIEKLSENDEQSVINAKVGEIHRMYDDTILKATGIERDGDEKSYKYLERAGTTLRQNLEEASKYKTVAQELEEKIAKGGSDEELKSQFNNLKAELAQTKEQYTGLQGKLTETESTYKQQMFGMQVDYELGQALSGIALKEDLPKSAAQVLLKQAAESVKRNKAEFVDDGQGGQRLVFRNADGAIMNNPKNQLNPYTAAELLQTELQGMGILDDSKKQKGAGTKPTGDGKTKGVLVISDARTQVEANEAITSQLLGRGLTRGTAEFEKASTLAWTENKIGALPER